MTGSIWLNFLTKNMLISKWSQVLHDLVCCMVCEIVDFLQIQTQFILVGEHSLIENITLTGL